MTSTLITNARIVNEGREFEADLRIEEADTFSPTRRAA